MASVGRRLTTVLAADLVGYSRLMESDEFATFQRLDDLRRRVIEPLVARHGGRIFKSIGDGLLIEFGSVVDAVQCALAWQETLASVTAAADHGIPLQFRIGISLGEVIVQDGDLFGTGVNVAARVQSAAAPGGVCVSAAVREQCLGRVKAEFEDFGEHELKNLQGRHRLYAVVRARGAAFPEVDQLRGAPHASRPANPSQPEQGRPAADGHATPAITLAVLPLADLDPGHSNALIGRGIAEEIVCTLAKTRWLFLIAANSTSDMGDVRADPRKIASDLGVRYVLSGSFAASSDRIRVSMALIDGAIGRNLASFRFDKSPDNPFAVIDEIAMGVVGELVPEISLRERARVRRNMHGDLNAWELYLRALDSLRLNTIAGWQETKGLLARSISIMPEFAAAHARLATCALHEGYYRWSDRPKAVIVDEAKAHAMRALDVDPDEALACDALASAYQLERNHQDAERWARKAIRLNATCIAAYGTLITVLAMQGKAAEALAYFEQLQKVSPRDPDISGALMGACMAQFVAGNMEESARLARDHALIRPKWYGNQVFLAASLAHLAKIEGARDSIDRLLEILPGHTLARHQSTTLLLRQEDRERLFEGLRLAGLPP